MTFYYLMAALLIFNIICSAVTENMYAFLGWAVAFAILIGRLILAVQLVECGC